MKYPNLSAILLLLLVSACAESQTHPDSNDSATQATYEDQSTHDTQIEPINSQGISQDVSATGASNSQKTWYAFNDPKTGMLQAQLHVPSTWKFRSPTKEDESNVHGPQGFKGYTFPGQTYMYTNDPMMQQSYQMAGQELRNPIGVEALVNQELIPLIASQGMKVMKKYPLPELAEYDRQYNAKLYGSANFRSEFSAMAIESQDKDGKPILTIIRYKNHMTQGFGTWSYSCNAMECDASYFAQAKGDFIYALVNQKDNPAQIAQYNASEQAKEQQSWSQHNQRMQSNQAAFDAQQRAYQTRQSASDIQMQTWRNNNAIQEQGHSNYINSINEQTNVVDPYNGQTYQVEAGANQTWMNGNGEYIQSNNSLYDPNLDPNANNNSWQEAPEDD